MHKIFFYNKFIIRLYMFRALCAHHEEVKIVLYSIWYHHTYRWPSRAPVHGTAVSIILANDQLNTQILFFYNKFIIFLCMFRALCAHHQEVKIVLYSIRYHHTYRWPSGAQVESNLCTGRPPTGVMIPDAVFDLLMMST